MSTPTMPPDTACRQCNGEGFVGTVTRSWCPWCRCIGCGAEVAGLCRDCAEDDWLDTEEDHR